MESLMTAGKTKAVLGKISQWYRKARGNKNPLLRESLNQISEERKKLYRCRPPEGWRVPLVVQPGEVEDGAPEETDIEEVVRGLWGGGGLGARWG